MSQGIDDSGAVAVARATLAYNQVEDRITISALCCGLRPALPASWRHTCATSLPSCPALPLFVRKMWLITMQWRLRSEKATQLQEHRMALTAGLSRRQWWPRQTALHGWSPRSTLPMDPCWFSWDFGMIRGMHRYSYHWSIRNWLTGRRVLSTALGWRDGRWIVGICPPAPGRRVTRCGMWRCIKGRLTHA
jgi:hypothetical protein